MAPNSWPAKDRDGTDRAEDYLSSPSPRDDIRPLHTSWDDLDFGVCLLLGLTAFVAGCVGLAVGVVTMWVVQ